MILTASRFVVNVLVIGAVYSNFGRRLRCRLGVILLHGMLICAALICLAASTSAAQEFSCDFGPSTGSPKVMDWVEPFPLTVVAELARDTLAGLGYRFIDSPQSSGTYGTQPNWTWPSDPNFRHWQHLAYPGAKLTLTLQPSGEWTRVRTEVQLLCATHQHPPESHSQVVDFDAFVLDRTAAEIDNALAWPLHGRRVEVLASSCAPLNDGHRKIEICERIAQRNDDNPEAHLEHALALIRFYRADRAWKPLRRYFELAGETHDVYLQLSGEMLHRRYFRHARQLLERALELWPDDLDFLMRIGFAEVALGRSGQALEAIDPVIAGAPTHADAYYVSALAHEQRNEDSLAIASCEPATRLLESQLWYRGDEYAVWLMLGHCYALQGQHRKAVSHLARAYQVDAIQTRLWQGAVQAIQRSFRIVGEQPPAQM